MRIPWRRRPAGPSDDQQDNKQDGKRPDLIQLAIDVLRSKGTPHGMGLAAELERGRAHSTGPDDPALWWAELEANHRVMLDQVRPPTPGEWSAWVNAFLGQGGDPRLLKHFDVPIAKSRHRFWVADADLTVLPLYGALALNIILPPGITDDHGTTGHTELWSLDSDGHAHYRGFHDRTRPVYVPVFTDTEPTHPRTS